MKRIPNSLHLFGLTIRILYWTKLVGPICVAFFVAFFFFDLASVNKNAEKLKMPPYDIVSKTCNIIVQA